MKYVSIVFGIGHMMVILRVWGSVTFWCTKMFSGFILLLLLLPNKCPFSKVVSYVGLSYDTAHRGLSITTTN